MMTGPEIPENHALLSGKIAQCKGECGKSWSSTERAQCKGECDKSRIVMKIADVP
jgi:hypothetical protein